MKIYPTLTVMKNTDGEERYAILIDKQVLFFTCEKDATKAWSQLVTIIDSADTVESID